MKQNSKRRKYLPSILIQQIRLQWHKDCRGDGWVKIPKEVRQRAEDSARDRWMLLLQLDTVEHGDFELMFGDCGHIYFYIMKEDLAARCFDRMWLVLQCC